MASTIDATQPVANSSLSSSVLRTNFAAAKTDIEALQAFFGTTGDAVHRRITFSKLARNGSVAPTVAAGTGAGTGPTITLNSASTDSVIAISILAGSTPATGATICTITFNSAFASTPTSIVVPVSAAAAEMQASATTFITNTVNTTTLVLTSNATTGLTEGSSYTFRILVIQ